MANLAHYYKKLPESRVQCSLCPHECILDEANVGFCHSRENRNGCMVLLNYSKTISISRDPIEKKPLYHFYPGSRIISLGPNSCNLSCIFCQNHSVSQVQAPTSVLNPKDLLGLLSQYSDRQVAFTYTEPGTWYEYIMDFAALAPEVDIVLVTNAYLKREPFKDLCRVSSAMNIDLKSIDESFYRSYCGGSVSEVLQNIKTAYEYGIHMEITNLLIPGLNSSLDQVAKLVNYIADIDPEIPMHFSAYQPAYRLSIAATPRELVLEACRLADTRLNWVYAGNLQNNDHTDSKCPSCGKLLILRQSYKVKSYLDGSYQCPHCNRKMPGVF